MDLGEFFEKEEERDAAFIKWRQANPRHAWASDQLPVQVNRHFYSILIGEGVIPEGAMMLLWELAKNLEGLNPLSHHRVVLGYVEIFVQKFGFK